MKKIIIILLCVVCFTYAQEMNKQIVDEKSGKHMLIGICDRSAFADTNYSWWFNSEYENYSPDEEVVAKIKQLIKDISFTLILGSWCSDSRREVPRLFKILDKMQIDKSRETIICVNRDKKSNYKDIEKYEVRLVPTIILNKDRKELGRIIEVPNKKLEEDILEIISRN